MSKYLDILTNIFKEEADKKASSSSVANISRATKTITTPIINRTVNNPVRNMGYQKAETKAPAVKNLSALSAIPTVKQNATVKYNGLNTQAQRNEQQAQRTGNTNYLNSYTPSSNANTAPVLSERDQRRIANKQEEYAKKVARQENYMISAPTYNAGSVPSSVAQLQKDRFYRNKTDWTGDDEIRILELKKLLETVGVGYNITKGNEAEYKSKVAALRDEYDNLLEVKKRVVGGTDGSFLPDNPYRTELQGIGDNIEAAIVGGFKGLKNLAVGTAAAGARMVDKKYGIDDHTAVNEWQKDNLVDNNAWNEKLAADNVDANSPLGVINAVAQGVGGMLPAIASNAVLPGSGIYVMMSSAAGNSMVEALQNGATEDEAYVYGLASGAVEGITEKITGGIPGLGAGGLDAVTDKVIGKLAKSAASRYLFKQAANMLGEGFEEWLSEAAGQYLIRIYDEEARNESISDTWVNGQADRLYSALLGSLTSLVMSAPTHSGAAVSEYNNELEYNKYRDEIINSFVKEGLTKKEAAEIADALLQNNVTAPNSPISATFNEATANSPMFNEVPQNGVQSGNTQLLNNANNGIIETGGSNNELLLNASSQWNVGEGARGQDRELAEGAGRNQSRETQAERRNYFGNLFSNEAVSARSERIGNQEISIAPLSQNIINNTPYVAEVIKAYADKGVTLVPLADSFSFTKKDGTTAYARAVYSNGTIYASVVDPEATLEELSAHEDFHRLVANSRGDIILEMASDLEEQFGEENIRERARQYESAYSGVYDSAGSLDIIEELCADVYAGMNNADLSQIVNKAVEGLEGEANGLVDSEGKAKSDIRLSISTAQELAYYKAANNGDTETAQRIVDEAAKAAGCVTNGKGKLIDLYHGTPSFGFTQFNGEIFTTDNKSVAAGYGKHEYAKERAISDKYIADDGTDKTLINNAKSVLGQSWRNVTNSDISSVIDETAKQSDSLAEAINSVWLIGDDCPQLPADVDNAVSWLLSLPGSVSEYLTDFANGDIPTKELAYWLDAFDESKPIAREYFSNHRSEFQGKTGKPIYDLITGYDLGDYAIDLRYKTLPILDSAEYLINSTTGGLVEKSQLRSQIENVKSVGAYHLYGNLGSNPLVIDASAEGRSGFWANVKSEELGFERGTTIESIVNKAKKSGYTSVVIKNVLDVAMNNYSSNVASDVYVFFDPSQVKSADPITYDDNGNVIPLSKRFSDSEDIRFSLTEEEAEGLTPAQQQVRDMMFNDYIYPDYNVSNRTDAPEEAIRFKSQYARDLYDTLIKDFGVQKGRRSVNKAIAEYASKYIEGKATQADTDTLFNVLYENGTESEYDNYKAAINDSIKGKKYYAPDHVRKELSYLYDTYKNFKNQSMGKFYLTGNATALRIDVAYQELQNTYGKLYFPDENHEAEMLANILKAYDETTMKPKSLSEVAENEAWEGVSFEESEARYKGILEATLNDFKQKAFKERVSEPSVDTRDILQMYQEVKSLKAAAETAEGAWKLSKTDNIIVDEMLRGAYDNVRKSGIRPDNAEGVQAVYEAKKALRDTQAAIKRHKNAHKAALFDWANNLISNGDAWNEKSAGLGYNTETAERNIRDIIGDNAEAKRVISEVFTPVHENEAESTRMKNDIRKKVKELGLSEKGEYVVMIGERSYKLSEAGLVQAYGEGLISDSRLKATGADFDKITNAVKVFRGIYEQLFEKQNEVLVRNGYPPVEHRVDYFPHFTEDVPETFFKKVLAKMGISIRSDMLPTDIAGLTDTFRPGKAWAGYMQQRKGDVTSYNALKGLDNYIETAGDVLYHTDDIQRVRALESALRYKYSDKGTQEAINEVRANDTLTEEQRQGALDELYKRDRTAFPNLVTWLRGYGDNLANKKSSDDRGWEHNIGRGIYNTVGAVEKRIAGNMVVGNISSALTNFIPLTQGWAEIKTPNMLYGLYDTIKSYVNNDGLAEESTFLTNRRGSDKLSKTGLEKTSDTLMFLMNGIDDLVSNTLVRSRYYQNVKGGMDSTQAMEEADSWAASVMADRSKGSMPLIFNNKNPLVKLGTMFQLEANNQLRYAFKDIPRGDKGPKQIALALFKMFLGAFLYNELYEKLAGRRPAFDPFGMIKQLIEDWKSDGVGAAGEGLFTNVVEEVPFVGGLVGGGRIPVSSALPDAGNIWRALTDKDGVDTEAIGKELMNPLFYFMFPVGGSQLKKTIQGISTVAQGGEKNANGGLKFDVEPTVGNYIQAGLFGKWALPEAQEYVDRGFTAMYGKARTEAREEAIEGGMNAETFDGYFNTLTGDTQIDALYALSKLNLSDEEKETLWSATSDWSKSYKEFYEENADIIDSGVSVGKYNELREAFKDLESEDKKYKLYQDATLTGDQKNALGKALEMGDIDFSSYESFILSDYTDKQRYMWDYVSSKGLKLEQYTRALDTYYKDGTPSKAVGIKRLTDAGFTSAWANWFYNNVVNNKEGTGGAETPEKKDYIINQLAQKGYDETYYDKAYEAYKKYGTKEVRIKRIVDAGYSQAWAEWFYARMQKKVGVNKNGEYYLY